MNLLLVDDELLSLEVLKKMVSKVLPDETLHPFHKAYEAIAFAKMRRIDIAFLDIDMRIMNGLEMAKELQKMNPQTNIIFVTGYDEYAMDAFRLYASAYLTKPVTEEAVADAVRHLRHPIREKRVRFQCFGNFEVYLDDKPMKFALNRTKELLAYLVDRNGCECRKNEIIGVLFEEENNVEYYKKLRKDLLDTFAEHGLENVIYVSRGGLAINKDHVSCDYYDYLAGNREEAPAEYMNQYSFAEETAAKITE